MDAPEQVAAGVFRGRGTDVNFYLLRDGDDLALVDAGYPGDADAVESAIRALGCRPEDVRAVLITHAHVDHIGATGRLHERYGVPTWTSPDEVGHARRDYLQQAGPIDVLRNIRRPGAPGWTWRIVRKGAAGRHSVPHAVAFPTGSAWAGAPLDLPARPVPVPMPGHTTGHTAYHLPEVGAILTGDGLVTGHALLPRTGPQLLPAMFNHGDPALGLAAVEARDADLLLPGHGEPQRIPIAAAVREARARISR